MADLSIVAGATSQSINVDLYVLATGAAQTTLAFNSLGLLCYYSFTGANATATAITLATLAAVNSAYSSGGFKELDATNMPGLYRLDLPNAALATSKGREVVISLTGFSGMATRHIKIELTGWDNQDGVRGGMTALANAAAGASGGLLISGSNAGTTTLGALTVTGTATISDGLVVNRSTSNATAVTLTGNGTGNGLIAISGSGATGDGAQFTSNSTNGNGFTIAGKGTGPGIKTSGGATGVGLNLVGGATSGQSLLATTTSGDGFAITPTAGHALTLTANGTTKHGINAAGGATTSHGASFTGGGVGHGILSTSGSGATGDGIRATAASTNGNGLNLIGVGTGAGQLTTGGLTGNGIQAVGGGTSGDAILTSATSGHGITAAGTGTTKHGINATGGATSSDGIRATGGGTGHGLNLQSGSGATGNALNAVSNATNGSGATLTHAGSGSDLNATTTPLTLAKTINITGFNDIAATAIVSSGAITTSGGKVSNVALVDTLTTYTGNTVQTGDSFARIGAPVGASISADIAAVKASVGTPMQSYTQPTGFLAATFPTGTIANTTNITAGTMTTTTNLTTNNDKTGYALTSAGNNSVATAVFGNTITEDYPVKGASITLAQGIYNLVQQMNEKSITGTLETVKKRDQSTTAKTFTLNDATNPSAITETT